MIDLGFRWTVGVVYVLGIEGMAMKGGRKNLKRAVREEALALQKGQSIMQVVSLRGSNLIEVIDAKGVKGLAIFPAKFQKSMWIKRGSFVVVDDSGREDAVGSGRKVTCIVDRVLFHEQVRVLQKSAEWPEMFRSVGLDNSTRDSKINTSMQEEGVGNGESSEDDGVPPLEANRNRMRPVVEIYSDSESSSDLDS